MATLLRAANRLDWIDGKAGRANAGYDVKTREVFRLWEIARPRFWEIMEGSSKWFSDETVWRGAGDTHHRGRWQREILAEAATVFETRRHHRGHDEHGACASHGVGSDGRCVRKCTRATDQCCSDW